MVSIQNPKVVHSAEASKYTSEYQSRSSFKDKLAQSLIEDYKTENIVDAYIDNLLSMAIESNLSEVAEPHIETNNKDKRDSFYMIAGPEWTEMKNTCIKISQEDEKELLEDFKNKTSKQNRLTMTLNGEILNLADTLNFPQMNIPEYDSSNLLTRSWPSARVTINTVLKTPMDMSSREAQKLINPKFGIDPDGEVTYLCKNDESFAILIANMQFIDTAESFIEESTWDTLDPKKQNHLMDSFDEFNIFLPFYHAKLTRPRNASSNELRNTCQSNFYDKLFSALVFFNKVMIQDTIRSIMNQTTGSQGLTPILDSPLGWLGLCSVANLYPLDKNYRPMFMLSTGNHHLTASKMLIAKLTAQKLGCWAALELADFHDMAKALQLGDWIKLELKNQKEIEYISSTSKRVICFDDENNVWAKGPRGQLSMSNPGWYRLESISNVGRYRPQATISTLYVKSAGEPTTKRCLIGHTRCCQMLVAGIKDTEDSEDQASSYMINFELERSSSDKNKIYIIETDLVTQPGCNYHIIELTSNEQRSDVYFLKWGVKKAFFITATEGVSTLKVTFSSKVQISERIKLNVNTSAENSPTKRAKGILTLEEMASILEFSTPLRKDNIVADVCITSSALHIKYSQ